MAKVRLVGSSGLDHRLVQLLAILASSGLPALIPSGQDSLTTHSVAAVGEGMIEAASVIETCRQRGHSPWEYLATAIADRRAGLPLPPLPQPGV